MRSFSSILLALSLPLYTLAGHDGNLARRHSEMGLRGRSHSLYKRTVPLTYYDITVGTTACGGNYPASAWVVALNAAEFGSGYPGPNCGKQITISYGGLTATATIVDRCPGCGSGGLDLTEGLFGYLSNGDLGLGVLQAVWSYGSGGGGGPPPAPPPPPPPPPPPAPTTHTTTTPAPQPTTQYNPPPPPPSPTPQTTTTPAPPPPPPPPSSPSDSSSSISISISSDSSSSSPSPSPSVDLGSSTTASMTSTMLSSLLTTTSTTSQPLSTSISSSTSAAPQPDYTTGPASSLAQPVGTIDPNAQGNYGTLFTLYQAIIGLGVASSVSHP